MPTRQELKASAKEWINHYFGQYFALFLPYFLANIGNLIVSYWERDSSFSWSLLFQIVAMLLLDGVMFVCIDLSRERIGHDGVGQKSLFIFSNGNYFIGSLLIEIIMGIFTFLWMLLLVIPGVIKSYSYSQAVYIYRDAIDDGNKISFLDAISKSEEMMAGHKADLFIMDLSFIGWELVGLITIGIGMIRVVPYIQQTKANFYVELKEAYENPNMIDQEQPTE
ncbi:DUF975 family protein [Lentilactobacillus sp. Marseille-Q4993]|uniref:DUF975 family protein n=1 Tax=Lentilactobacillus sp. Marseille-Q4993 TaxID=3039492 RepID=UPI0024BD3371|nr:DUF975 family protein [Lentilactobacillus sp. Marseille-Q4993]